MHFAIPLCVRRTFKRTRVGLGVAAAMAGSVGAAVAADIPRANVIDVEGLECKLAFESDRESGFIGPLKPDYLYLLLQAPRANRRAIDSVSQFNPDKAEPEHLISPALGDTRVGADFLDFVSSNIDDVRIHGHAEYAVEEPYSFRIERKELRLSTRQNRIPNYVVGDYVSPIFKTQPKWPEVDGDVNISVREPVPSATFDGSQYYVMVFACRPVDPKKLRSAAHERYRRVH